MKSSNEDDASTMGEREWQEMSWEIFPIPCVYS